MPCGGAVDVHLGQLLSRPNGVSAGVDVALPDGLFVGDVYRDGFGAGGADVETEDHLALRARGRVGELDLVHALDLGEELRRSLDHLQVRLLGRAHQLRQRGQGLGVFPRDEGGAEGLEEERAFAEVGQQLHPVGRPLSWEAAVAGGWGSCQLRRDALLLGALGAARGARCHL